jgi:crotonobetainyl-CoA:carnitine CoA-transferase CaiB-like acyl-CoA transferase
LPKTPLLKNIRILDFTRVLAGPYATRILADFGAEVIKVQPLFGEDRNDIFARGYFNTWNRNKLGVTLNLDQPEGIELAKKLVAISDIVIENFSPRVMANFGLDYENLRQVKKDIIMVSLSSMGATGPWRDYVGFGPTVQAFSGMTALTSYPGKCPSGLGFSYADHAAGLYAVLALLGALEQKNRTGEGQFIDISELEAMTSLLGDAFLNKDKITEQRTGGVYRCRGEDRWCAISISGRKDWTSFKKVIGKDSWTIDKRFALEAGRVANADELDRLIEEWTINKTDREVMGLLQKEGIAACPVQDAEDLANDAQLKAGDFFIELEHPELGKTISDASPIKLSDTPAKYNRAAPLLGQDNDYVYGGILGLSKTEMKKLSTKGVI